jgi:hypothetical protein
MNSHKSIEKQIFSKNSKVVPVLLEESTWQVISPVRFPVKTKPQYSPPIKKVDFGFEYVKPPQELKILDPEQRVQLMYDYTKSHKEDAQLISFETILKR